MKTGTLTRKVRQKRQGGNLKIGFELNQEEGNSEPRRNGAEIEPGDESRVVKSTLKPLPPLGPVVRTALIKGEVMG